MWYSLVITALFLPVYGQASEQPRLHQLIRSEALDRLPYVAQPDITLDIPAREEGKGEAVEEQQEELDEYGLPRERKKWKKPTCGSIILLIIGGLITKFAFC